MIGFKKEPQIKEEDLCIGCLNCSTADLKAPMDMIIEVGFGSACVTKNGEVIDEEQDIGNQQKYSTVSDIEKIAREYPDHDWRIHRHGPLHGEVFQRQGENNWVCIESNHGFA